MNISFAWTTPAVLAAHFQPGLTCKTRTRRDWTDRHIEQWRRRLDASNGRGVEAVAWNKSARFQGKPIGKVLITSIRPGECSSTIPDEDWVKEGFDMLQYIGAEFQKGYSALSVWGFWRMCNPGSNIQTVVDFELLGVTPFGLALWEELRSLHGDTLNGRAPLSRARNFPKAQQMRVHRVHELGISLSEAAGRLGLTPIELANMEIGQVPFPEGLNYA